MRNVISILLFTLVLCGMSSVIYAQSYENSEAGDLQALIDIYVATNGDNWYNTQDGIKPWDINATSLPGNTEWFGVTTEIIGGERRVVHLDLQRGTHTITSSNSIPDDYGNNLTNAEEIGDNWELIEGQELPESIGNLTQLRYLNLKHNTLRGPVPQGITNLVNAKRILLAGHPREPQYGSGTIAPGNHPTGTGIPSSEGVSKAAQALNFFEGPIPENVGNLQNLEIFELAYSGVSGPIPAQFGDLPELKMLLIHGNSLSGELPPNIGNATKLRYLYAFANNLSGQIPGSIGNLSDMKHLRLSGNNFTGTIPVELGEINDLRFIALSHNSFGPQPFPEFLLPGPGHNQSLDSILFGSMSLTGELPQTLDLNYVNENRFNVIQLENNNLSGQIPEWISQHNFIIVNLSNNQFEGELPESFFDNSSRIYERLRNLYLHRNNLEGPLPSVDFGPDIRNLFFYENNFSGSIPSEWGNIETDGRGTGLSIRLHQNNLSGIIPVDVANITMIDPGELLMFDISSNRFHDSDITDFETELLARHPDVDFDKSNQNPSNDGNEESGTNSPPSSPSLNSPSNGNSGTTLSPVLNWSASEGAETYRIQVSQNSTFSNLILNTNGLTVTQQSLSGLENEATYYWRVRAANQHGQSSWSSVWSFTTESDDSGGESGDQLPAPGQVYPANNAESVSSTLTFEWTGVTGADEYILHVDREGSAPGYFYSDAEGASITETTYTISEESLPGRTHQWRVQAVKDGQGGEWSPVWSFTTSVEPVELPSAPQLTSPDDGTGEVPVRPSLSWAELPEAESYTVHISTNGDTFNSLAFSESNITETSINVDELNYSTAYYWRVKAENSAGESEWSEVWNFMTRDVPTTPPAVPNLSSPADEETEVSVSPVFTWNSAEEAEIYTIQVSETSDFSEIAEEKNEVTETWVRLDDLSYSATYWWRVKAVNSVGESNWTEERSFTTREEPTSPPAIPDLAGPENEEENVPVNPFFTWNSSADAESYTLQVSEYSTFSFIEFEVTDIRETWHQLSNLEESATYYWRVKAVNSAGESQWSESRSFNTVLNEDNYEESEEIETTLSQNYPNPFNPTTTIRFTLSGNQQVSLRVYDMAGRQVATLFQNTTLQAGQHETTFNANRLASGIYFYRLITENEIITRRMTLMK